ncbi:MAG: PIN domain-containing protein [Acidobacteriaceae bacterium]|nr:PIN domain-containing protein [Acidobacteriaceae bacterium]
MILVDTSIWIRFLANREPYAPALDELLSLDEVAGHELIYGELLVGDRGGRRLFLAMYERIHRAAAISHREVVEFVHRRKLYGRGVGWVDVHLLASALVARFYLWTADSRLAALASEFNIGYEPPRRAGSTRHSI